MGSFNQLKALSGVCQRVTAGDSSNRYSTSSSKTSSVTVGAAGDSNGGPAMFDSSANGYAITCDGGNMTLYRVDAGAFTILTAPAQSVTANDVVKIDVSSATNVVVTFNGATVVNFADSTYRAGLQPAIYIFGTITFTDWTDGISAGGARTSQFQGQPMIRGPF